jgi:hypothetical protein
LLAETSATSAKTESVSRLQEQLPGLSSFVRQSALDRYAYIAGTKEAKLSECNNWDDFFYGNQLAVIMIAGKDLKIFFKAHFYANRAQVAVARDKSRDSLFDFFREYCNLTAGAIKQGLHTHGILSGISLPMATSGHDELVFSDSIRKDRMLDYFSIGNDQFSFVATVSVDVSNEPLREILKSVKPQEPSENSDDIEWL